MRAFTIADLAIILREGVGEAGSVDWEGDASITSFEDLGYDSIALLETAARVRRRFGVRIEDELFELRTPVEFVDFVNRVSSTDGAAVPR